MAYIPIPEGFPGIRRPMMFRPETAKPLNELVAENGYTASTLLAPSSVGPK